MPLSHSPRRREKTDEAIVAAFVTLLFEQGFGAFTIADVARRAGVGRSTFYQHFATKHALLEAGLARPFSTFVGLVLSDRPARDLIPILQHFRDNQRLGRDLFLSSTRPILARALARQIEARLEALCRAPTALDPILPLGLIAAQLAEAALALIEPWALRRVSCTAEQLAAALSASIDAAAAALLRRPPQSV
jgi:AcrR family transcriptional regulator